MIRYLQFIVASLVAIGSCGGSQQPLASNASVSGPRPAQQTSPSRSSAHVTQADPPAKETPTPNEGLCKTSSFSRECKCEGGDVEACLQVADMAFRSRNHELAIIKTYSLCQMGTPDGCFRAAYYMKKRRIRQRFGASPETLRDKGVRLHQDRCADGDAAACYGYGRLLFTTGKHVAADPIAGEEHLSSSCSAGHAPACAFLADAYDNGIRGVKKDKKRALLLLDNACTAGGAASCTILGDKGSSRR